MLIWLYFTDTRRKKKKKSSMLFRHLGSSPKQTLTPSEAVSHRLKEFFLSGRSPFPDGNTFTKLVRDCYLKQNTRPTWVAQLVKYQTLDFCSGHDPIVHGIKPCVRLCTVSTEPAWDSLSLPLSLPFPPLVFFLPLRINK